MMGQVAFWQTLGFIALVSLVWALRANRIIEFILPGTRETEREWFGAWITTAAIFAIGIIVVVNTHQQQKRLLRGLIRVCAHCRKVHVEASEWQQIEDFISARTLVEFTHGICPECHQKLLQEMDAAVPAPPGVRTT